MDSTIQSITSSWTSLEHAGAKPVQRRPTTRSRPPCLPGSGGNAPSPENAGVFLSDETPTAYEKSSTSCSPIRVMGTVGRHWLDLARYGETSGSKAMAHRKRLAIRDWVSDALIPILRYDKSSSCNWPAPTSTARRAQLSAPDKQDLIPTAFLRVAPGTAPTSSPADVRQNYLSEVTTATGMIFLGLSCRSARCTITNTIRFRSANFLSLQAFFSTTEAGRGRSPVPIRIAPRAKAAAKIKEYEEQTKSGPEKKELDAFGAQLLKRLISARNTGTGLRSRFCAWIGAFTDEQRSTRIRRRSLFRCALRIAVKSVSASADRVGSLCSSSLLKALISRKQIRLPSPVLLFAGG